MKQKPKVTPEQIAKLPGWAQTLIKDVERERDVSVRELNKYMDNQTPAEFFIDSYVCTGEQTGPSPKRQYIQGRRMSVKWKGVHLDIMLCDADPSHWPGIQLSYSDAGLVGSHIALIPTGNHQVMLMSPHNMRVRPADPNCKHESKTRVDICEDCGWKNPV